MKRTEATVAVPTKVDAIKCPHCGHIIVPRTAGPWRCGQCWGIIERPTRS